MGMLDTMPGLVDTMSAPWMAQLSFDAEKHDLFDQFGGTGMLVTDRHMLTCAHTFNEKLRPTNVPIRDKKFFVRYGDEKVGQGARRDIERIIVHPDFTPLISGQRNFTLKNGDLAIIVLAEPADVAPLAIADKEPAKPYTKVSVLGWPLGTAGTGNLHQVNTAVLPYQTGLLGGVTLKEFVVANFVGPGQLDYSYSGAPVLTFGDAGPRLVGVMSRGVDGLKSAETHGVPGIATNVTEFREWVDMTVQSEK